MTIVTGKYRQEVNGEASEHIIFVLSLFSYNEFCTTIFLNDTT